MDFRNNIGYCACMDWIKINYIYFNTNYKTTNQALQLTWPSASGQGAYSLRWRVVYTELTSSQLARQLSAQPLGNNLNERRL
jgi:hypothetical protein